jgi:hypothetical protein
MPGPPVYPLIAVKGTKFRMPQFADMILDFEMENGRVIALKQKDPSGEFVMSKIAKEASK